MATPLPTTTRHSACDRITLKPTTIGAMRSGTWAAMTTPLPITTRHSACDRITLKPTTIGAMRSRTWAAMTTPLPTTTRQSACDRTFLKPTTIGVVRKSLQAAIPMGKNDLATALELAQKAKQPWLPRTERSNSFRGSIPMTPHEVFLREQPGKSDITALIGNWPSYRNRVLVGEKTCLSAFCFTHRLIFAISAGFYFHH